MGEYSAYYVPEDQKSVLGRSDEIRLKFWDLGVFLDCLNEPIANKLAEFKTSGVDLPKWQHDFSFGGMGIEESEFDLPVPEMPYSAQCPHCSADVYQELAEVWYGSVDINNGPNLDAPITCSSCRRQFTANEMNCPSQGFARSRWYIWVSDIDPDHYDKTFKRTLESVIGPCKEVFGWDT